MEKDIERLVLKDAVVSIKTQVKTDKGLLLRVDFLEYPQDTTFLSLIDRTLYSP